MKCLQATQLISKSCEKKLTSPEKTAVFLHLIICKPCRQFRKNCNELSELMKSFKNNK